MLFVLLTYAQRWSVDKSKAKVGFTITHLMLSEGDGNFKSFNPSIASSKPDLSDAIFESAQSMWHLLIQIMRREMSI